MGDGKTKQEVWDEWVEQYAGGDDYVPLFETDSEGIVQTIAYGRDGRPILQRSDEMEALLRSEGAKVVDDWKDSDDTYEGLIYMMYTLDRATLIPRYVGKAGKYGRDGEGLSANLRNIRTNSSKFARWGNGYAYHIGELSAALLEHHLDNSVNHDSPPKGKYQTGLRRCLLMESVSYVSRSISGLAHGNTGILVPSMILRRALSRSNTISLALVLISSQNSF